MMEERRLSTAEELYSSLAADVDIFWLLFGSVLVFFMQAGEMTWRVYICREKAKIYSNLLLLD